MGQLVAAFGVVVVAFLALLLAASLYFYRIGVRRGKKTFLKASPDLDDFSATWGVNRDWLVQQPLEEVEILSADGLRLAASWFPAEPPSERTVILAHGYSSKGLDGGVFARHHHAAGWNVLMPDDRGHGRSEGDTIGFGWPDRLDYLAWIRFVLARSGADAQLLLHGVSMGGATVLMTGGEELPAAVRGIISDCAYSCATEILSYQLIRLFKLPPFPLVNALSLLSKIRDGYFLEEVSALKQVRKVKVPVLFIHGEADTFVPAEMSRELYQACPTEKELLLVPGARHAMSIFIDPAGYARAVTAFVTRVAA